MKIKMLALVACLVVPFQLATADIKADFKAGLSIAKVLANATAGGMSVENAVTQMVAQKPGKVAQIVAAATSIKCSNAATSVLKKQCINTIKSAAKAASAITKKATVPASGDTGAGGVASPS